MLESIPGGTEQPVGVEPVREREGVGGGPGMWPGIGSHRALGAVMRGCVCVCVCES